MEQQVVELSANALKVLQKRYLRKDEAGEVVETPREMFERVARAVAQTEASFPPRTVRGVRRLFYRSWPASTSCPTPPPS